MAMLLSSALMCTVLSGCCCLQPEPGGNREELCELVEALLTQKAEMLQEYVGITFFGNSAATPQQQQLQEAPAGLYLTGLPQLLDGYVPDLSCLPQLILQLARDVDWETEKGCFKTLAAVIGDFYAVKPLLNKPAASQGTAVSAKAGTAADHGLLAGHRDQQQREWLLRHVVMPAIKFMLKPPQARARDGTVLLLTSMDKLYRVFERCGW